MNTNDLFPSTYLKSDDIPEGDTAVYTIDYCEMTELGQGSNKSRKPVLFFREVNAQNEAKRMVLNKTNTSTLSKLFGMDTDLWTGKRVEIGVADVSFQGEMVKGLRILNKKLAPAATVASKAAAAANPVDSDADQGFGNEQPEQYPGDPLAGGGTLDPKFQIAYPETQPQVTEQDVATSQTLMDMAWALEAKVENVPVIKQAITDAKAALAKRGFKMGAYTPGKIGEAVIYARVLASAAYHSDDAVRVAQPEAAPF